MSSTTGQSQASARRGWSTLANTLVVAGGYLLSRVLGLAREVVISRQFGTSAQLDSFRAVFGVIDLLYIVIAGGALGSAFIPVFAGFLAERRDDDAWRLAGAVTRLAFVGLVAACLLTAVFAGPIVAVSIGRGFPPEQRALTVALLRLMLIQPLLLGLGGIAKATLESFDRFTLPVVAANIYNLSIILAPLLFPALGIFSLAWGVVAGSALFLLVQLPGLRSAGARLVAPLPPRASGRGWLRDWAGRVPGLGRVGTLLAPRLFGQGAWQINLVAIITLASTLEAGAVAANGYALTLMMLPHGLFALSLGTVLFPQLSRHYAAGDGEAVRRIALGAVRGVLFLALPVSAIYALVGFPVVRVLLERRAFTAESSALTAEALRFYALGLAAFAASEILVRTFYAMQDTRTPVYIGMLTVGLNISLGWLLVARGAGLNGLAAAFSTANTAEALLLLLLLRRKIGPIGAAFWRSVGGMLVATLAAAGALLAIRIASLPWLPAIAPLAPYRWPQDFLPLALWLLGASAAALLVYGVAAALLRLDELHATLGRLRAIAGRVRRRARPES